MTPVTISSCDIFNVYFPPVPVKTLCNTFWTLRKLCFTHLAQKSGDVCLSRPRVPLSFSPLVTTCQRPISHFPKSHVPEFTFLRVHESSSPHPRIHTSTRLEFPSLNAPLVHSYQGPASRIPHPSLHFPVTLLIKARRSLSSPVPLPDLYFDSFSYLVPPIVWSAGGIV